MAISNSANKVVLAVLAELEAQAQKKGKKSIVNGVLKRLRDNGVGEQLLGEISALNGKKNGAEKTSAKSRSTSKTKGPSKTKSPSKAKPRAVAV